MLAKLKVLLPGLLEPVRNLARAYAPVRRALGQAISNGLDLIFPPFCQGCALEGSYLCLSCQNAIRSPIHRCPQCGKNSPLGQVHSECRDSKTALTGLMVAAEYSEPAVRNLIWQLKYNSVREISKTMGLIMTDFMVKNDLADYFAQSIVIPVPTHKKRLRFRGFNQSEEIAKHFAANMGLAYCEALVKAKSTARQVDLERQDRIENLRGAFALDNKVLNTLNITLNTKKIILIDDVATTGATLNECARAVRKAEPSEIWGLVAARN